LDNVSEKKRFIVFKGTGEGQEVADIQADKSNDEPEPKKYSFFDMVDSSIIGEEH
jgi:hypothetical protein